MFKLITMHHYSKLSAANQTGLLASAYSQTCSVPVFSGVRNQQYSADFFEQLNKRTGITLATKTIPQLTLAPTEILNELRQVLMSKGNKQTIGTVVWSKCNGIDPVTGGTVDRDFIVEGRCKFFLGSA